MLSITKVNNSIKVEGLDNKQFPDNGTIMIPLNAVILTLDDSNIATFRSAANNDVLFSGVITDIQISGTPMTKQTITTAFTNVANSSGGGGTVDAYTKAETDALLATKANESELSDYATVESLATVATSGSYNDLSNKPTIPVVPTNVSAFNNDAGYLTQHQSLADYSTTQEMNTAIATATNDMATMTWVGEQGYLTQHQDISGLATKSELAEVEAEIPSLEGYATEQWVENQNYLTEHQSLDNYYTKAQTDTAISTATNDMATETWVEQQGYLTQHQDISGLATKQELATHTENGDIHVTAAQKTAWSAKADLNDIPDVTGYIDGAVYDSQTKRINFKHGDTVVAYIDATPFVVDGMVDTVEITGGNLVITWNTDAGKQSTSIPLTDIFNPDNYYNKTDTDALLAAKANSADLAAVATSGDYDDLANKPTIPTVPTNVSAFTNDAGYTTNEGTITGITMNGVSKGTSGVVDLGTVITEHQSLAGYAQTADLAAVATSGSYTDLTDKPNLFSGDYNDLTNKPTIPTVPTNVSAFTNDAGYTTNTGTITGITMNGTSKGTSGVVDLGTVITEHQSLEGYVQSTDLATVAISGLYDDLTNKPTIPAAQIQSDWTEADSSSKAYIQNKPNLAAVATSGSYNDLTNTPSIPAAQIQSDWNEADNTSKAYIQNKPTIPTVPTNVSAFTNDAGYTTNTGTITGITMNGTSKGTSGVVDIGTVITDISGKQDVIDSSHKLDADLVDDTTSTNKFVTASDKTMWNGKQDELVSGTSIKTINNESILGSGNITISGGSSYTAGDNIDITNDVISVDIDDEKKVIASALTELHNDKADKSQLNNYQLKGDYQTGAQVDAKIATATSTLRTEAEAINVEKVDAAALTDLNARVTDLEQGGGGGGITGITMNGSAVTVTSGVADLGTVITDKSDKQDTLVSGTNIKTINNESILGSGNITIQGGGTTYTAGTNMEIVSSGGTDTINCTLPIKAGTNGGVIIGDNECSSTGLCGISFGHNADNSGAYSLCMGSNSSNSGQMSLLIGSAYSSGSYNLIVGTRNNAYSYRYSKDYTCAIGYNLNSDNIYQVNFGEYNVSNHASNTFGDAGNTLLSIGNGYDYQSTHNRHNAFEIRQNGDIYIPDTDDTTDTSSTGYSTKPMLRLQDYIATIRSLVTRVTALETALGNISSSLDTINGEVI